MSGGLAVRAKNVGWCGAGARLLSSGDYPARVFCPRGLALTAWGPQVPLDGLDSDYVMRSET